MNSTPSSTAHQNSKTSKITKITYLLITKQQLNWYKNLLKNNIRYFKKGFKNYLFRCYPLTTKNIKKGLNYIDLRNTGNNLKQWQEKVKAPEFISLVYK